MSWKEFNLNQSLVENLTNNNYINPSLIQQEVINQVFKEQNLIVSSPTGSGKTHAFLIPIINMINEDVNETQSIIISPTRELAMQIYQFAKQLVVNSKIKISLFTGGKDLNQQSLKVNSNVPQIIIGTVSRIKSLYEKNILNITTAKNLVIDECDMLFDLGFVKELDFIISKLNNKVQILVFSATINQQLENFLRKYLTNTKVINFNKDKPQPKIDHNFILCRQEKVKNDLVKLVGIINPFFCLVFVNNKNEVDEIAKILIEKKKKVGILHGGLTARNRSQVFKRIKNLDYQYLVCTDIGARGIDITGVSHVISLNLPNDISYYLHRAGRTGRNNGTGISYVFFDPNNAYFNQKIKTLNISPKYFKFKNNELVEEINVTTFKKIKKQLNPLAVQTINQFKSKKNVKPGYKKELNKTLEQIAKKERKEQKRKNIKMSRKNQKKLF